MAEKLIDELGRTTLPWKEYQAEVKKIWDTIPRGESKWPVIKRKLGIGYWDGIEYSINSNKDTKLGFQRKKLSTRAKNREQFIKNRKENEKFTDITSEQASKDWKKKNITDWNNKDNPTGKKLVKGTEDYNKYFRRYEHRIKVADPFWKGETGLDYMSGDPENLTWTTKSQWDLKDAGEMTHGKNYIFDVDQYDGDVTYTPRQDFNPHESKFKKFKGHIDETIQTASKIKGVTKGTKLVGKAIPYVGLGIAGAGFTGQVQAAVQEGGAKNYAKLGLRTLDLGLEVVDLFTMGLSTPVTLAAQASLMAVEDYIDNGPAKISTIGRTRR